ncbi:MAG: hypothetical protein K0S09_1348 [Sphingobacteriaceae bacterium]|jgi:hypothetical protein|nr:hypothetical protein [Sphingobacteriaceae bacterium]
MQTDKPDISRQAFWDVDFDNIDYQKHDRFVVEKVVERGKHQDFINLLKYYGFDRVKKLVLNASWLSDSAMNFCCVLFHTEPKEFKCYEKKQLNQAHWNF